MSTRTHSPARQRGVALISSILLLVIITILALSLFRSFGTQEKIAGNLREKERALHAAESAQEYGEWWLLQGNNAAVGAVACAAGTLNANLGEGQICNQTPQQAGWWVPPVAPAPPWASQVTYLPPGMSVTAGVNGTNNDPPYAATPGFYIADLGLAADGQGEAYQVDAYGYGGGTATVAVVESSYEVQQGVVNRGGL
jgi:type IV pilus assembly protein PilX